MVKGKTSTGFEFEYDPKAFDDMEFLDMLVEAEKGEDADSIRAYSMLVLKLLGKAQRKRLYDHLRTEAGRVPIEAVKNEIAEIMAYNPEGKN